MPDTDDADGIFCRVGQLCRCHFSRSHIAGVLRTVSAVNSLLADRVRSHSIIGGKCANNDSAVGTWPLIQQGVRGVIQRV